MTATASRTRTTQPIDDAVSRYWERVLAPSQEQDKGYLNSWFLTCDGFQGLCVVDRGQGSSRLLELRNHCGTIKIVTVGSVSLIEKPSQPEEVIIPQIDWGDPEVGDTVTWDRCPSWWNPNGERLSAITNGCGIVDYWRSPVPYERLRVVIKALATQEVDA